MSTLNGKLAPAVSADPTFALRHRNGATSFVPWYLSTLAKAYGKLGQLDDACRRIDEAITMTSTTEESGPRLRLIALQAKSPSSRPSQTQQKLKRISSALSPSLANSNRNPGNSAPP